MRHWLASSSNWTWKRRNHKSFRLQQQKLFKKRQKYPGKIIGLQEHVPVDWKQNKAVIYHAVLPGVADEIQEVIAGRTEHNRVSIFDNNAVHCFFP